MSTLRDDALEAHDAGLGVLPPTQDGEKRPVGKDWKRYQAERPSRAQVELWYADPNRTGIGYVTGAVSGGLEVLDFDDAASYVKFYETAREVGLTELSDRIERGYSERTAGGGVHCYYRCDQIDGNMKLAERPAPTEDNPRAVKVLIETRGEGGYIVAAPSHGDVHPSGAAYRVFFGSVSTIPTLTPDERATLLEFARTFDEKIPEDRTADKRTITGPGRPPGTDFNERSTWHEVLDPHGWTWLHEHQGITYLRRPGKDRGVSATLNWDGRDHLRIFTSNSVIPPGMYDRFAAFTHLNHGGDFSAAAKALRAAGYGDDNSGDSDETGLLAAPKRDWPVLRPEALHGLAGDIVRTFDPQSEADPAAVLLTAIVEFGNSAGRSAHMMVGESRHGTNEYAALAGDSAKARKGVSRKGVHRVMQGADRAWADFRCVSGLSSGEGMIWAIRDAITKNEPIKDDHGRTTGYREVVVEPGVEDKRLMVFEEELSTSLKQGDRQGNTLSETERRFWDSPYRVQSLTKNSPAATTNPHVSILGHITIEELKKTMSETDSVNGRANRYIWFCVRRSKLVSRPTPIDEEVVAALAKRMRQALDHARKKSAMTFSDEAAARWDAIYPHLSKARRGVLGSLTARSEAHTLRLALIYALLDCADAIEVEHLNAALAVWDYSADSVLYLFGDSTGDSVADKILTALREQGDLSREEISTLLQRNVSAGRINNALETLSDLRLAMSYRDPSPETTGRKKTFWTARVNTSFSSSDTKIATDYQPPSKPPSPTPNAEQYADEENEVDEVTAKEAA